MKTEILDAVESKSLKKKIPHFEIGDIVDVHCRIKEGEKERTQIFTGTVIARKGRGINETFMVRRMVGNEGVERIFPLHSPNVLNVRAIRSGKTRRAKLYYLRQRTGIHAFIGGVISIPILTYIAFGGVWQFGILAGMFCGLSGTLAELVSRPRSR